ncbi:hypothetical protein DY000_02044778 [Brassica cretica]|uniref:Uncharacterized protein n=1 Tax=Brassica cretica TaxID=69181 RepID=A0ABQ7F1Q9_BRACR|nr:hypothetical protein DY000_02044778 [Brassica cretica]
MMIDDCLALVSGVEPWTFQLDVRFKSEIFRLARLAEEIRCLPNDHEAKLQILEIGKGKISLYAASSAIKEVQKLILDPK